MLQFTESNLPDVPTPLAQKSAKSARQDRWSSLQRNGFQSAGHSKSLGSGDLCIALAITNGSADGKSLAMCGFAT
jgi:hypothetical protein